MVAISNEMRSENGKHFHLWQAHGLLRDPIFFSYFEPSIDFKSFLQGDGFRWNA